jgi:hypothetical protein
MDAYNTQPCAQTCANAVLLALHSTEISRIFPLKPWFPVDMLVPEVSRNCCIAHVHTRQAHS